MKIDERYTKNFNNEQIDFLGSGGENVLVSASAGTGKTTTMVQKLVYLILEEKISIDKIMVVTFTTTAAMEMKQRLYNKLQDFLKQETDTEKIAFIYEQLDKISNADIGTIDSICKRLVNRYFYELNIDPIFSILSGKEQQFVLDDAIDNVLKKLQKQDDKDFYNLFIAYNKKRSDETIKSMIKKLYEFKSSLIDKNDFENQSLECYSKDISNNKAINIQIDFYKNKLENIKPVINSLMQSCYSLDLDKLIDYFENYLNFVEKFKSNNNYREVRDFFQAYKFMDKPRGLSSDFAQIEDDFNDFVKEFKVIKDGIKNDFSLDEEELKMQFVKISELLTILFRVENLVETEYKRLKQNLSKLDFNDLERYCLDILKNPEIKQELKDNYKYIFIDEYQDVNLIQEYILTAISNDKNLFMIGDVKQSIYAFRQSTPELFVKKFNLYNTNTDGELINFNKNYRSSNNILQFVNRIFDKLITKQTLGIDYTKSRLESGKELSDEIVVDMHIVSTDKDSTDDESIDEDMLLESKENIDTNKAEAELVVQQIFDLIKNKKYLKDGVLTNYNYGDIAILTRTKGRLAKEIFNRLNAYQIPCVASFKNSLFENYEIKIVVDFLKLVSNPFNDYAIAGVLSSFMYDLKPNDLAEIKIVSKGDTFSEQVLNYEKENDILEAINQLKQDLNEFRNYLVDHTVLQTVQCLYEKFDIVNYFKSLPNGAIKESNLLDFLKFISSLNIDFDLEKMLQEFKIFQDSQNDSVVGENENSVKILTIHASKGLEWPGVILCGLGGKFSINKNTSDIVMNNQIGVGLNFVDNDQRSSNESLIKSVIKNQNKQREINEEIRLLYVALTRAKNHLKLVGCYKLDKYQINKIKNIYDAKNYFDLLFKSNTLAEDAFFYNQKESFEIGKDSDKNSVNIVKIEDIDITENYIDKVPLLQADDSELTEKLKAYFEFKYPFQNSFNIAIKNSVTSILKEETNYENVLDKVTNFSFDDGGEKSIDYMKIGTYYHSIMEKLNYNAQVDFENIKTLFEESLNSGQIEQEYKRFINLNQIYLAVKTIQEKFGLDAKYTSELKFLLCTKHSNLIEGGVDSKIIVQGVIDLLVEKDGKYYIVDFKTNRNIDTQSLVDMYKLQIDLYSKALELERKTIVSGKYLYSFSLEKLIEIK